MKTLSGFRFVEVQHGDTLQRLAARELGSAALWAELIAINDLVPPYLTGDPALAGPKVRLYGQAIMVPATEVQTPSAIDRDLAFGTDVALLKGMLEADETGDLVLAAGVPNLNQAIRHRINTPLGELLFHETYGCGAHKLKGAAGQATTPPLAAEYVKAAVSSDPRVQSVNTASATLEGDAVLAQVRAVTVTGANIDVRSAG